MTNPSSGNGNKTPPGAGAPRVRVDQHIVEIVSDSGEGAQRAGQSLASMGAKVGNGVWTVEIIPAEIKPPARMSAGASGIRIRLASHEVTNMGDEADLVVAFNEQVLYGRIGQNAYRPGTVILLESKWANDGSPQIREQYAKALKDFQERGYVVKELALDEAAKAFTPNPAVGKNMFVLGMLLQIYGLPVQPALEEVSYTFRKKTKEVVERNHALVRGGYEFAAKNLTEYRFEIPKWGNDKPLVVMNGNQAVGLGVMASGMDVTAMYPITPATSASHYLGEAFFKTGGFLHQAEDEIAACGFAVGAAYAGKTSCTITSGPGLALKTEMIGLAVMSEIPLVVVVVQRGGPSTGLPTKVEQGDLLAAIYGEPGDTPKIVIAPATIEECFHFVITARKLAEAFRMPVIVLTDANLATGVAPFPRPNVTADWFAPPIDQTPWKKGLKPYEWDPETGLSARPIPGQPGGEYVLTGLAHTKGSHVAYDPDANQLGCDMRSRKLAALQRTLTTPEVHGDPEGDLLIVGWGSTLGAIEEAVDRARKQGHKVSSLHVRFVSPMPSGLKEIFQRFRRVMTVEINYSDKADAPLITPDNRRYAQLAWLLRAQTLLEVGCWSNVHGQPIRPAAIHQEIVRQLSPARSTKNEVVNVRA